MRRYPLFWTLAACCLTGCGAGTLSTVTNNHAALTGRVYGGDQPVIGATVQLYAAGTGGYGSASTPLLVLPVLTGLDGSFTITGDYLCPSAGTQVYLTATGGNPGLPGTVSNPALAEMAALGSCGNLSSSTNIVVNEVVTVASVYALAQFMTDYAHVGTSSTNTLGLANAFLNVPKLVSVATGVPVPNTGIVANYSGTVYYDGDFHPTNAVNTLGDVLASCVNSTGSTADGSACGRLFQATTPAGGIAATDTVGAALRIAQNPVLNVATIFYLAAAAAPFQPTLAASPGDWALGISTSGGTGTEYVKSAALDGLGTYWTAGYDLGQGFFDSFMRGAGVNTQFLRPISGYPTAIALDQNENLWTTEVAVYSPSGSKNPCVSACGPYARENNSYLSVAIDANGNVWALDVGGALLEFDPAGTLKSPANGYPGLGLGVYGLGASAVTTYMAFDGSGSLWVINPNSQTLFKLNLSGSTPVIANSVSVLGTPVALALDHIGAVWLLSQPGSTSITLTKYNADGSIAVPAFTAPCAQSNGLAIDGGNNVWLGACRYSSNGVASSTSRLGSAFDHAPLSSFPALDASGNLWITGTSYHYNGITELFGVSAPTGASLADALRDGTLAARP